MRLDVLQVFFQFSLVCSQESQRCHLCRCQQTQVESYHLRRPKRWRWCEETWSLHIIPMMDKYEDMNDDMMIIYVFLDDNRWQCMTMHDNTCIYKRIIKIYCRGIVGYWAISTGRCSGFHLQRMEVAATVRKDLIAISIAAIAINPWKLGVFSL